MPRESFVTTYSGGSPGLPVHSPGLPIDSLNGLPCHPGRSFENLSRCAGSPGPLIDSPGRSIAPPDGLACHPGHFFAHPGLCAEFPRTSNRSPCALFARSPSEIRNHRTMIRNGSPSMATPQDLQRAADPNVVQREERHRPRFRHPESKHGEEENSGCPAKHEIERYLEEAPAVNGVNAEQRCAGFLRIFAAGSQESAPFSMQLVCSVVLLASLVHRPVGRYSPHPLSR